MWLIVLKRAFGSYFHGNNSFVAGTLAFSALLAIFPFIIFLVSLTGLYSETFGVQQGIHYIISYLPSEVEKTFTSVIREITATKSGGLITFGFLGTLYVLISAVDTLRMGLNKAYDVEECRPFFKRLLHNIAAVFFMAVVLICVSIAIILGPLMLSLLYEYIPMAKQFSTSLNLLRYAFGFTLMVALLTCIYCFLPNIHQRWRRCLPGALAATFCWMGLASLFSIYLKFAGNYNVTYGSLSGIIITMIFLKVSAMIFLLGAEINHAYLRVKGEDEQNN